MEHTRIRTVGKHIYSGTHRWQLSELPLISNSYNPCRVVCPVIETYNFIAMKHNVLLRHLRWRHRQNGRCSFSSACYFTTLTFQKRSERRIHHTHTHTHIYSVLPWILPLLASVFICYKCMIRLHTTETHQIVYGEGRLHKKGWADSINTLPSGLIDYKSLTDMLSLCTGWLS